VLILRFLGYLLAFQFPISSKVALREDQAFLFFRLALALTWLLFFVKIVQILIADSFVDYFEGNSFLCREGETVIIGDSYSLSLNQRVPYVSCAGWATGQPC